MIDFSYWPFFFVAILGAIVANATGAGGGVVFVPAFNMLGVGAEQIIATSFAIQCFGMTAGMLAWRRFAKQQLVAGDQTHVADWRQYYSLIILFTVPAVVGLLIGQYVLTPESAMQVKWVFKVFSGLFGVAILLTTVYIVRTKRLHQSSIAFNTRINAVAVLVSFIGGLVTAWLSIGIGELVAVMLILMRFPVRMAIGVAVSVSAICVWFGVQKYVWLHTNINVDVLAFAAPAAVIGGSVAKRVAALMSPVQLKSFIAVWILFSAAVM